jgi:hypothetical protein
MLLADLPSQTATGGLLVALGQLQTAIATQPLALVELQNAKRTLQLGFIPSVSAKTTRPTVHGVFISSGERYSKRERQIINYGQTPSPFVAFKIYMKRSPRMSWIHDKEEKDK